MRNKFPLYWIITCLGLFLNAALPILPWLVWYLTTRNKYNSRYLFMSNTYAHNCRQTQYFSSRIIAYPISVSLNYFWCRYFHILCSWIYIILINGFMPFYWMILSRWNKLIFPWWKFRLFPIFHYYKQLWDEKPCAYLFVHLPSYSIRIKCQKNYESGVWATLPHCSPEFTIIHLSING